MAVFTAETASEMGRKGAEIANLVIKQRKLDAELRRLEEEKAAALIETYEGKTLMRVRLQLDKVFQAFMEESDKSNPDAAKLDRLASAQARLGEQERQLAGRPMPGSLKPTQQKQSKARTTHAAPSIVESAESPQSAANEPNG